VVTIAESDFGVEKEAGMSYAFSPALIGNIPGIEAFSRVIQKNILFSFNEGDENIDGTETLTVDQGFLYFFTIYFIHGSAQTSLQSPYSLIIDEATALKHYGTTDVLGKIVKYNKVNYTIDAVFRDLPKSSSIKGNIIVLNETINARYGEGNWSWRLNNLQNYILLNDNTTLSELENKLTDLYVSNNKWAAGKKLSLQPIADVHYSLDVRDEVKEKTDRQYVSIFAFVAIFILASSIFNYISLSVSQSIERAKEKSGRRKQQRIAQTIYNRIIIACPYQLCALHDFSGITYSSTRGFSRKEFRYQRFNTACFATQRNWVLFGYCVALFALSNLFEHQTKSGEYL